MPPLHETELKAVVDDVALRRRRVEEAGAMLVFEGRLEDRRYDDAARSLAGRDHVLRVRVYRDANGSRAELGWKGPTRYEHGFKVREELSTPMADPEALTAILDRLGYVVTREIEREIAQYELAGTVVRFERYPRMDDLVEVEGAAEGIELAVAALGLPREAFTSERLRDFMRRFEQRTGLEAALCEGDLSGRTRYAIEDA